MRDLLNAIKSKSSLIKVLGLLIALAGGGVYMLGDSINQDAERGLMILDSAKLDETRLK